MEIRFLNSQDVTAYQALRLQALQESPTAFGSSYEQEACLPVTDFAARLCPGDPASGVFGAFDNTHILHQYIETSINSDRSVRKRAQNNINENSEHHSPVCPSSTLHIDGINAQSIPKQKPQSGFGNVLGTSTSSIARTLCS